MNALQLIRAIKSIQLKNSTSRDALLEAIWPLRQFAICNKPLIETIAECPPGCYRRYLLNAFDDHFCLVLIVWGANAASPIHNHGDAAGIVLPVFGSIKEAKFQILQQDDNEARLRKAEICHLKAGELTTIEDNADTQAHLMLNEHSSPAATVHLYLPAIDEYDVYHPDHSDSFHIERHKESFAAENQWRFLEEASEKLAFI